MDFKYSRYLAQAFLSLAILLSLFSARIPEIFFKVHWLLMPLISIFCWFAVTILVIDILLTKSRHSVDWILNRLIRTLCVIAGAILFHSAILKFYGFAASCDGCKPELSDWTTSFYFSIVTWTTLGYGDFSPAKDFYLFAASEALMGYITMSLLIGLVFFGSGNSDDNRRS